MATPPTIGYRPPRGPPRRHRYEPCRDDRADYWRVEEEWTGCRWRPVGREPVSDVTVDGDTTRDHAQAPDLSR